MAQEYEYKTHDKLGWGLKKWVFTRPDIWKIENLFWDRLAKKWYVVAKGLGHGENMVDMVDFHVTTEYIKKVTEKNSEYYTLVNEYNYD